MRKTLLRESRYRWNRLVSRQYLQDKTGCVQELLVYHQSEQYLLASRLSLPLVNSTE